MCRLSGGRSAGSACPPQRLRLPTATRISEAVANGADADHDGADGLETGAAAQAGLDRAMIRTELIAILDLLKQAS